MLKKEEEDTHKVKKVAGLLDQHKAEIMEELGNTAFDPLSPRQVATELEINVRKIPDLVRQGWLAAAPVAPVGTAHFYYRWRVVFVKRYRRTNKKR